MKILKANYREGVVLFATEEHPDKTFVVNLKGITTLKEIIDKLKELDPSSDSTEKTFNDLNVKSLEGTDI